MRVFSKGGFKNFLRLFLVVLLLSSHLTPLLSIYQVSFNDLVAFRSVALKTFLAANKMDKPDDLKQKPFLDATGEFLIQNAEELKGGGKIIYSGTKGCKLLPIVSKFYVKGRWGGKIRFVTTKDKMLVPPRGSEVEKKSEITGDMIGGDIWYIQDPDALKVDKNISVSVGDIINFECSVAYAGGWYLGALAKAEKANYTRTPWTHTWIQFPYDIGQAIDRHNALSQWEIIPAPKQAKYMKFPSNFRAVSVPNKGAVDVSIGDYLGKRELWIIDLPGYIYVFSEGRTFVRKGIRKFRNVSAGWDGTVFAVDTKDTIYRYDRDRDNWTQIAGALSYVAVGDSNSIYGFDNEGKLYKWDGAGFRPVSFEFGKIKTISVNPKGEIGCTTGDDFVYKWDGTNWIKKDVKKDPAGKPIKFVNYVVSNHYHEYAIGANGKIYRSRNNLSTSADQWEEIGMLSATAADPTRIKVAVDNTETVAIVFGEQLFLDPLPATIKSARLEWAKVEPPKELPLPAGFQLISGEADQISVGQKDGKPSLWFIKRNENEIYNEMYTVNPVLGGDYAKAVLGEAEGKVTVHWAMVKEYPENVKAHWISAGNDGTVLMVGTDRKVYQFDWENKNWNAMEIEEQVGISVDEISVADKNHIWMVGDDHRGYRLVDKKWVLMTGASQILTLDVGSDGTVVVINIENEVPYLLNKENKWEKMDVTLSVINVVDANTMNGLFYNEEKKVWEIWSYDSKQKKWERAKTADEKPAEGFRDMDAGPLGYFAIDEKGLIWHTPEKITPLAPPPTPEKKQTPKEQPGPKPTHVEPGEGSHAVQRGGYKGQSGSTRGGGRSVGRQTRQRTPGRWVAHRR